MAGEGGQAGTDGRMQDGDGQGNRTSGQRDRRRAKLAKARTTEGRPGAGSGQGRLHASPFTLHARAFGGQGLRGWKTTGYPAVGMRGCGA